VSLDHLLGEDTLFNESCQSRVKLDVLQQLEPLDDGLDAVPHTRRHLDVLVLVAHVVPHSLARLAVVDNSRHLVSLGKGLFDCEHGASLANTDDTLPLRVRLLRVLLDEDAAVGLIDDGRRGLVCSFSFFLWIGPLNINKNVEEFSLHSRY